MQDVLLTTEQIANYLKIDKFTVYRLVAQKRLPGRGFFIKDKLNSRDCLLPTNSGPGHSRETKRFPMSARFLPVR